MAEIMMHARGTTEHEEKMLFARRVGRLGRKRTTKAAIDSPLPIHRKSVKTLSWEQADITVKRFDPSNFLIWKDLTRPFRDPTFWVGYECDPSKRMCELQRNDISDLVKDGLLQQVPTASVKQYATSFSVLEEAKARRRWILWPSDFNMRARRWRSLSKFEGKIKFPSTAQLKEQVKHAEATCWDYSAFFHQFQMHPECAIYFALLTEFGTFIPTTVPTGAMNPPLFAQILMAAICNEIMSTCTDLSVLGFIDNIRIAGATRTRVNEGSEVMKEILSRLGITLNADFDISPEYTFLGMRFNHHKREISVGAKTVSKLTAMRNSLHGKDPTTRSDILAMFGTCVWASTVLAIPRAEMYYIYKFVRRRTAGWMEEVTPIWPSIIPIWLRWLERLIQNTPVHWSDHLDERMFTLVTDSSSSGWGGCCFKGTGEEPERIVGARWEESDITNFAQRTKTRIGEAFGAWGVADKHHINYKELCSVRRSIQNLQISNCCMDAWVDSTSTQGMLRKMDSPVYLYNRELLRLDALLRSKGIFLRSVGYVNTKYNPADGLSRLLHPT
jgi:hypothetical protein